MLRVLSFCHNFTKYLPIFKISKINKNTVMYFLTHAMYIVIM